MDLGCAINGTTRARNLIGRFGFSAKAVREDGHPYYPVVITPQRMCEGGWSTRPPWPYAGLELMHTSSYSPTHSPYTGYSVTALTHCIRTVYPSNQAVRDQLEVTKMKHSAEWAYHVCDFNRQYPLNVTMCYRMKGRINRICQEAPTIKYWVCACTSVITLGSPTGCACL